MGLFTNDSMIRQTFQKVAADISELKNGMNSWILHLNSNQSEMKRKILELDQRIRELEMEKVREMMK